MRKRRRRGSRTLGKPARRLSQPSGACGRCRALPHRSAAPPERYSGSSRLWREGNAATRRLAITSVTNAANMMAFATIVHNKSNVYGGKRDDRRGAEVKSEADWTEDVKRMLRAEMTRRGITYEQLSEKLAAIGVADSRSTSATKLRGASLPPCFWFNVSPRWAHKHFGSIKMIEPLSLEPYIPRLAGPRLITGRFATSRTSSLASRGDWEPRTVEAVGTPTDRARLVRAIPGKAAAPIKMILVGKAERWRARPF